MNTYKIKNKLKLLFNPVVSKNIKMINSLTSEEFEYAGRIKFIPGDEYYRDNITFSCKTCGSGINISLTEKMTKEEFLNKLNEKCTMCDKKLKEIKDEYNEIISYENKIMDHIKPGDRVKIIEYEYIDRWIHSVREVVPTGNFKYGTLVRYTKEDLDIQHEIRPLRLYRLNYNKAEILLDEGLKTINHYVSFIEKYDNRLTEGEIKYIEDILTRHSIDNYTNATLINMNKAIIKKININK